MTEKFKVLFCTDNFPKAIQWTKEQLQSDPSIEVRYQDFWRAHFSDIQLQT